MRRLGLLFGHTQRVKLTESLVRNQQSTENHKNTQRQWTVQAGIHTLSRKQSRFHYHRHSDEQTELLGTEDDA